MKVGHDYPQSYNEARRMGSRRLTGTAVALIDVPGGYAVHYYDTDIVTFYADGRIFVCDYGSVTTNRKINVIGGRNFGVYSEKRVTKLRYDGDKFTVEIVPRGWVLTPKAPKAAT